MGYTAKKIEDSREAKGWSRQDLADKLGVSVRTISNLENGGTITPAMEIMLENIFKVELVSEGTKELPPFMIFIPREKLAEHGQIIIQLT